MPLRQYLTLINTMARMALRAEAARYYLGYVWWLVEPLLYVAVFYVVFEVLLESRRGDFLMFLMVGKFSFIWFSKSVTQASNSIVSSKGLIGKINVPKTLFPMAVIQEGLYRQAAVFVLLFIVLIVSGYAPSSAWWWLVPLMLVNYVVICACSLVGACLVCLVRDFSILISLGMIFLLFTSGIFWDVRDLGDPAKTEAVLVANPLAFLIDGYRQVLMGQTPPDAAHLLQVGLAFAALFLVMVLVMRKGNQYLALKALTA